MMQQKRLSLFFRQLPEHFLNSSGYFLLNRSIKWRRDVFRDHLQQIKFFAITSETSASNTANQHIM